MTVYYPLSSVYEKADSTIIRSSGWSPPPNGYEFDGVDDRIGMGNRSWWNLGTDGKIAIELVVKGVSESAIWYAQQHYPYVYIGYDATNSRINLYYYDSTNTYLLRVSDYTFPDNGVYHIIINLARNGNNRIIINNDIYIPSSDTFDNNLVSSAKSQYLAYFPYANSYQKCEIIKFAVYNTSFTDALLTKLFNNGRPWESRLPSEYFSEGAGDTQTSGTLTIGKYYRIKTYVAGDDFTNVGAASNATGVEFLATGTTPTTYTNGSTIEALGETFSIHPESVGIYSAYDTSENGNHATINGATPIAKNDIQRAYKDAITGDTTLTDVIEGGYFSEYFVFENTTANAVTIDVGTTASGNDIISGGVIGANETVLINAGLYTSATDTYYISSADWNSSSLNMKLMSKKL